MKFDFNYKEPKVVAEIGCNHKGDIKIAHLDITKLKKSGWMPKLSSIKATDITSRDIINEVIQNLIGFVEK